MPQLKVDLVVDDKGSLVLTGFGSKVEKAMWSARGSVRAIGSELAVVGAGLTAFAGTVGLIGSKFVSVAAGFDNMKVSLDTITKGQGAEWFEKLNDWALKMPVNTQEAIKTFTMLRSMGLQPTIEDMTTLVDTSAAMGGQAGTLEGIARALGQIQTKGKVSAEELMQLAERGIPAYEILQEKLGLTREQVANIGNAGVDANKAVLALLEGMGERYGGLSEKLNQMWSGQVESLRAYGDEFMRLVMESGPMREMESALGELIERLDQWKKDGTLKAWAEETGRVLVQVKEELAGIGAGVLPLLRGIGSAAADLFRTVKQFESIGGPSVGEWGLVGYALLRGGPQAAALVLALEQVNKALHAQEMGIQDLPGKFNEYSQAVQNIMDVISGQRDWNTGAWAEGTIGAMTEALERGKGDVAAKFKEISEATGVAVVSMDDLDDAVKDGLLHFDDAVGEWKKGAAEMAAAVEESAGAQEAAQKRAIDAMRKQYDDYAKKVFDLQRKIAGSEQDLAAELRAMARTGMTDLGAWKDRKREAEEYYRAAQRAADANQYDAAQELAKKAKEAYADLNEEVKSGETVQVSAQEALQAAMAGVEKAGQLNIELMKKQQAEAAALANELNRQSGDKFGAVTIDESTAAAVRFQDETKKLTQSWETMWETVGDDGHRVLESIAGEIDRLDGSTITIYTKHVEKDSAGGLVGRYAFGGMVYPRLASPYITSGGGIEDDVPALLKRNEFVVRPEAVSHYGVGYLYALNNRKVDPGTVQASTGGWMASLAAGAQPRRFAEGGLAQAAGAQVIDLRYSDNAAPARVYTDAMTYAALVREAGRRRRYASA